MFFLYVQVFLTFTSCFSCFLQYFQKDLPEIVENDPEQLLNLAFSMKINTKQMKKWEKEYAAVRKKEQEEMGELRVSNYKNPFLYFNSFVQHFSPFLTHSSLSFSAFETKTDC